MNINYVCRTIEMTTTEAKNAGRIGTNEFDNLAELRAAAPGFPIVVVKNRSHRRSNFARLTIKDMQDYITAHPQDIETEEETRTTMVVFNELRGCNEKGDKIPMAASVSHGELRMWFLAQYPELEESAEKIRKTMEAAKQKRERKNAE